jgi:hypothetical protein
MRAPREGRAAPASGSDPRKIEQLAGPLNFKATATLTAVQSNFVEQFCGIDPAMLSSVAASLALQIGGPRDVLRKALFRRSKSVRLDLAQARGISLATLDKDPKCSAACGRCLRCVLRLLPFTAAIVADLFFQEATP